MSMAIAHFAFGAAMTTLVTAFLVPVRWYPRTVALAGGGWAMLPDFHWVSPVWKQQLHHIHRTSVLTDLFWLHRTLDNLDVSDSKSVAAVFLGLFLVSTLLAEHRDYRVPSSVRQAYEPYLDVASED